MFKNKNYSFYNGLLETISVVIETRMHVRSFNSTISINLAYILITSLFMPSIMLKEKLSLTCKLKQLVIEFEFEENIFSTEDKILFSKVCEVKVASVKCFSVI